MKIIVITGPSGSGKSYISNKISKFFSDTIIIKTDSYYRDSRLFKFLSILFFDIYDRPMSIRRKELMNNLKSIKNKSSAVNFRHYDFKRRKSIIKNITLNKNDENRFLIIEGIFAHRLDINYKNTINIICEEDKNICLKRRLQRDQEDRGRTAEEITRKFSKSWYLFYQNIDKYINCNKIIKIKTSEKTSYNDLFIKLVNT